MLKWDSDTINNNQYKVLQDSHRFYALKVQSMAWSAEKPIFRDEVCKSVRIPNKIAGQSKNRDQLIASNNSYPCFISINTLNSKYYTHSLFPDQASYNLITGAKIIVF